MKIKGPFLNLIYLFSFSMSSSSCNPSSSSSKSCSPSKTISPSSSCCPPSSWGMLKSLNDENYNPKGKEEVIGDDDSSLPIYFSTAKGEPGTKKVIIVFTDVYGFSNRLKYICDTFSEDGYHVIMPDCFRGETFETNPDIVKWLKKYPIEGVMKDIKLCQQYIEMKYDADDVRFEYSSIGFCWGGWAIAKSKAEGIDWKCAASPHPSTKIESVIFGNDEKIMLDKIDMPFLLLPAGNDMDNLKPGSKEVETLTQYGGKSILFEKMIHGWVTRGDLNETDVKENVEKALMVSLEFINEHNK